MRKDIFINQEFYKYYESAPIILIDIGASGGISKRWQRALPYLSVIMFEPDERGFRELVREAKPYEKYINCALYKNKESVDFHLLQKQEVSSILRPSIGFLQQFPEVERFDVARVIKIETDTLDNQLKQNDINDIDFIKLDAQGAEDAILEGAENTLNNVIGLEVEVEFSKVYSDQPLFGDIDKRLRSFGFELFDLNPHYWKRSSGKMHGGRKGQLIFADALYLSSVDSLNAKFSKITDLKIKKAKILKAVSIALLYGYVDYALEIFKANVDFFDDTEKNCFKKEMEKRVNVSTKMPDFPGRGKIAKLFKKISRFFQPSYNDWAMSQGELGNE